MNCLIRLTCFSFRPYLKVGQASLESRNIQNSFAFYPPSLHGIQPKKQSAFRRRKWKKSPTLSRWNYFTNRNAVSKYFLTQYSVLSFLILRCSAPPFCFLRMSRPFTLLTQSSSRSSAVFHFFVAVPRLTFLLSPQLDSFVCFHAFLL